MSKICYVDNIKFNSIIEASYYTKEKYNMTYASTIKAFNNKKKKNFIKENVNKHKSKKIPWNKGIKAPQCANFNCKNNNKPFKIDGVIYKTINDAVKVLGFSKHIIIKRRILV